MLRIRLLFVAAITFTAALISYPGPSYSQTDSASDSREQELIEKRKEKQANPPEIKPNKAHDLLLYIESRRREGGFGIQWNNIYPKFGGPGPGSGFGGGARYYDYRIHDTGVSIEGAALFSTRNYQLYSLQLGSFERTDPAFFTGPSDIGAPFDFMEGTRPGRAVRRSNTVFFVDFQHRRFPQERFWGLGPDSSNENRSNYRLNSTSVSLIGGYKFNRLMALAGGAGVVRPDLSAGTDDRYPTTQEIFDDIAAPGLDRQTDFLRLATVLYFNYQDTPGNPHKGGIVGIFYSRFDEIDGNEFDFNRFAIDARHYIPLGSKQRTLALRLLKTNDIPDGGSRVPFYMMNTLGGSRMLRGYPDYRYRDANLFYISTEYRWEPAPALEFALYYETGKTYADGRGFDFRDLSKNFGAGVRIKGPTGTFMRLDISRGNEGTRLQFAFGPSF